MPELPEVQTTVMGLSKILPGLTIKEVWSDLPKNKITRPDYKETIKYLPFYKKFVDLILNKKIISVERRAKNVLINISGGHTILIHMKMTGHLLFGEYIKKQISNNKLLISKWEPKDKTGPLNDSYNRFIHVVFTLSNDKHLVFCDARKFGKVTLIPTNDAHKTSHLKMLGPEPLDKNFTLKKFIERISKKRNTPIKTILMDQTLISGIGNIYSDEMLWLAGINPEQKISEIPKQKIKTLYEGMKEVLNKGIDFGGDSMSDYRNVDGERGNFQHHHNVYRKASEKCGKKNCKGVIIRKVIGGRSAHYCSVHQKKI